MLSTILRRILGKVLNFSDDRNESMGSVSYYNKIMILKCLPPLLSGKLGNLYAQL